MIQTIANRKPQPSNVTIPANPIIQRGRHGQVGRPPIREQEAIEALNPLIHKDQKTLDEIRQESQSMYKLVNTASNINSWLK